MGAGANSEEILKRIRYIVTHGVHRMRQSLRNCAHRHIMKIVLEAGRAFGLKPNYKPF
jgi:hypothetical protein